MRKSTSLIIPRIKGLSPATTTDSMFVKASVSLSILSVHPYVHHIHPSIRLSSICTFSLSVQLSVNLSIFVPLCPGGYFLIWQHCNSFGAKAPNLSNLPPPLLTICLSKRLSVCPSFPSTHTSITFICLSVFRPSVHSPQLFNCLSIYPSLCLFVLEDIF